MLLRLLFFFAQLFKFSTCSHIRLVSLFYLFYLYTSTMTFVFSLWFCSVTMKQLQVSILLHLYFSLNNLSYSSKKPHPLCFHLLLQFITHCSPFTYIHSYNWCTTFQYTDFCACEWYYCFSWHCLFFKRIVWIWWLLSVSMCHNIHLMSLCSIYIEK